MISAILFHQICIMFIYILLGMFLYQNKVITDQGSKEIASILLYLVIPCLLLNNLCVEPTDENLASFALSVLGAVVCLGTSMLLSRIIYPKKPIHCFASTFSNAGFIGIPLVQAAMGEEMAFILMAMIVLLNILQCTYGVAILTGDKQKMSLESLLNPIIIAAFVSLLLFFTGIGVRLPDIITAPIRAISSMNAPLAMLVLGVYFAKADYKKVFFDPDIYLLCFNRLILIPFITALVLHFLPIEKDVVLTLLIAAAAPVGTNVAVYSQLHDLDYSYASGMVVCSTLLSILTVPVFISVIERII